MTKNFTSNPLSHPVPCDDSGDAIDTGGDYVPLAAEDVTYDDTNTGTGCTQVQCALEYAITNGLRNIVTFDTPGNHTYTKPEGLRRAKVTVVSAGGGGQAGYPGAGASETYSGGGAGGGAGSAVIHLFEADELPDTVSIFVGAGGAGGSVNPLDPGEGGGVTTFGNMIGIYGGNGGNGSGGSAGIIDSAPTGATRLPGSGGDARTISYHEAGSPSYVPSGAGGSSLLGGGGGGVYASSTGADGSVGGGGGGGCANGSADVIPGGKGGDGIVIIEEYF